MTTVGDIYQIPMFFPKSRSTPMRIASFRRSAVDFQKSTDCSFSMLRSEALLIRLKAI